MQLPPTNQYHYFNIKSTHNMYFINRKIHKSKCVYIFFNEQYISCKTIHNVQITLQLLYITLTSSVILVPGGGPVRGLGLGHSDTGGTGTEVCSAVTSRSICDDAGAIWDFTKAGEANADRGDCLCYKIRGKKKYWISLRNKRMSEHIWSLKKEYGNEFGGKVYFVITSIISCCFIRAILLLHEA